MLLSKIFLGSVVSLAVIQQTITFCTWKVTHLFAPTFFSKNAASKVYRVRNAMHCVLKCSQTDQCQAVGFSRNLCTLYQGRGTVRETPSKKTVAFLVRKSALPTRFVDHRMQLNQDAMRNRETSLSVRSQTTAIMKVPSSTEGSPIVASSISTSVPSTTKSVQADRKMTPGACGKNKGYTFLPETSMCLRQYTEKRVTWSEARDICRADGGDLVKLTSSLKYNDCYVFARQEGRGSYWIGLVIRERGGVWVDGTPMSYRHRRVYKRDKANPALCVTVNRGFFAVWKKKTCQPTKAKVVCEIV